MVGILVISHGGLSEGVLDSLSMFFENEKQIDSMRVNCDTNIDYFKNEMGRKIKELDTGDGVLILADIFGGSPCNSTYNYFKENVRIVTGFNFPMLISAVTKRNTITDKKQLAASIIKEAQDGIIDVNERFESAL